MPNEVEDTEAKTSWVKTGPNLYGASPPSIGAALPAGNYVPRTNVWGEARFELLEERTDALVRFPGDVQQLLNEVERFWDRGPLFKASGIPFKRGILLYGLPGAGKSSLIRLALKDVTSRGGLGFILDSSYEGLRCFDACYPVLRSIQPTTPLVVVIEDVENLCDDGGIEAKFLDLLDGQRKPYHGVLFIATTNHIDRLPERVKNRPSRFDKKIEVALPTEPMRREYMEHLAQNAPEVMRAAVNGLLATSYLADTHNMSLAHVKELFTAVAVMGSPYEEVLESLRGMQITAPAAASPGDE